MISKSQIQALDPTQPSLPLKKGRAATMTHDYKRHGSTTLFAALDVKSGIVIGECQPRHRAKEFIRFLKKIDRIVHKSRNLHLTICQGSPSLGEALPGPSGNPRMHIGG